MMSLSACRLLISRPCCSFLANQCRAKHSASQVKRLFKNNPARARVDARMGVDRTPLPLPKAQFPAIVKEVKILHNGWSAPASDKPEYPFDIRRTRNKPNDAIGFLPVYSKFRYDLVLFVDTYVHTTCVSWNVSDTFFSFPARMEPRQRRAFEK
jgi:hypothetical protein